MACNFADYVIYLCYPLRYDIATAKQERFKIKKPEVIFLAVRERVLALNLLEKQKNNSDYAKKIGVEVRVKKTNP